MKFGSYIRDRIPIVVMGIAFMLVMEVFLVAFHSPLMLCIFCGAIFVCFGLTVLLWDFFRRKRFFDELVQCVEQLDKKYYVLEMLDKPDFLEGELYYQILYEIDKSMAENVKRYELNSHTFKEYIEMWIHEVKIPIASLRLMAHNEESELPKKYINQLGRLDNLIEQVLYYVRAEHAEQDYLICEVSLKEIVKKTAMNNKDDLLESDITLSVSDVDYSVMTDSKWMEFIINQIINNSVKYRDENKDSEIKIWAEEDDGVALYLRDNGIGIAESDLPRIFDKSFTGQNGRGTAKSTGMGLYIAKHLCDRLGHQISVTSKWGEYTEVVIRFGKNELYRMDG